MKIYLNLILILMSSQFSIQAFAEFKNPKCSTHTQAMWDSRFKACFESFKVTPKEISEAKKQEHLALADKVCNCLTDEIVNNYSCEQAAVKKQGTYMAEYDSCMSSALGSDKVTKIPLKKKSK